MLCLRRRRRHRPLQTPAAAAPHLAYSGSYLHHATQLRVIRRAFGVGMEPRRWLGSRVVCVLDSGTEGPGFKPQPRRCRVTIFGKLFTPIVTLFMHQAAKLVAALLRVAGVTAGLAESNGSLPPGL